MIYNNLDINNLNNTLKKDFIINKNNNTYKNNRLFYNILNKMKIKKNKRFYNLSNYKVNLKHKCLFNCIPINSHDRLIEFINKKKKNNKYNKFYKKIYLNFILFK